MTILPFFIRVLDFTHNPTEFAELPEFIEEVHQSGMKFVPILGNSLLPRKGVVLADKI